MKKSYQQRERDNLRRWRKEHRSKSNAKSEKWNNNIGRKMKYVK